MDGAICSFRRYLNGDQKGLEEIVQLYGDSLLLFINGYVHDFDTAEDLMEDSFVELIVHKKDFREEASVKTYLFKIARNKALNYLKRRNKYTMLPLETAESKVSDESVEKELLQTERNVLLYEAVMQMKEEYRDILFLLYFEDMSYAAAAAVMKKNKKQIDNLACRAKESLRLALEKEGFVYEE